MTRNYHAVCFNLDKASHNHVLKLPTANQTSISALLRSWIKTAWEDHEHKKTIEDLQQQILTEVL
jgi:hypothetical protein